METGLNVDNFSLLSLLFGCLLLCNFFQNLFTESIVPKDCTFYYFDNDSDGAFQSHVDQTEWLWNSFVVYIQGKVFVVCFKLLCYFILDPLKCDSFFKLLLPEWPLSSLILSLENQKHSIACNLIL